MEQPASFQQCSLSPGLQIQAQVLFDLCLGFQKKMQTNFVEVLCLKYTSTPTKHLSVDIWQLKLANVVVMIRMSREPQQVYVENH